MPFELIQKPAFISDLIRLPRDVQKRLPRAVERIGQNPFSADGHVKKIAKSQYRNLYRYRLGDYRLIYAVGTDLVVLLAVGPRGEVYRRLGLMEEPTLPDGAKLAAEARAMAFPTAAFDPPRENCPDEAPAQAEDEADEVAAGAEQPGAQVHPPAAGADADQNSLLRSWLELWGIDPKYHDQICSCSDIQEFLDLPIPDGIKELLIYARHPANLQQLQEQQNLDLSSPQDLERFMEGSLRKFLLKLDPEQARVASRSLQGPALVKGGPGTGKSLVALHRVRNLLTPEAQGSLFGGARPSVLFVTYTRSLISACQQLLRDLLGGDLEGVEVTNVDRIVRRVIKGSDAPFNPADERTKRAALDKALARLGAGEQAAGGARGRPVDGSGEQAAGDAGEQTAGATANAAGAAAQAAADRTLLSTLRPEYLLDEFDWVLEGRNLRSLAEYQAEDRTGRGIRLDARTRAAVWRLHERYLAVLAEQGASTWDVYRTQAAELLETGQVTMPRYDAVIIDEAQDLTPAALRLCAQLAKDERGLFLTADASQSIYNRGFSWNRVHQALHFQGRTTVLRRNYRSTRQIAEAAIQLLRDHGGGDVETFDAEPVREGPRPTLIECNNVNEQVAAAEHFLRQSAEELRLPVYHGAVLVGSNAAATSFAEALNARGVPARHVQGNDLDLDERVVKVMTIHTAKGLEFPLVVVARLDEAVFPYIPPEASNEEREAAIESGRRVLFVALSRAMRRLAVVYNRWHPSMYIGELDRALWQQV